MPRSIIEELVTHIQVSYFRAGTPILERGQKNEFLYFIRSGAVEVFRSSGEIFDRLGEGSFFGQFSLLRGKKVRYPVRAIEDALIYMIPDEQFQNLCETHDSFADFMEEDTGSRLQAAVNRDRFRADNPLLTTPIEKLIHRRLVAAGSKVSIQEAAQIMTREKVSSLIILEDPGLNPDKVVISGLITDRDIRKRAVAKGLPLSTPVSQIMSTQVITCPKEGYGSEVMQTMIRRNLHHIPVMDKDKPIGVLSASDIIQYESHGSVYLSADIFRQTDTEGLKELSLQIKTTFVQLVSEGGNSHMIGSTLSGIGMNFIQRLLELGEKKLGAPPVPYAYVVMGSMARNEQLIATDQDNAMILNNGFDPGLHDAYFKALAEFVSSGLELCGYPLCKGDIMATNSQWRQPLKEWQDCFTDWIRRPNPQTLLNCSIFFDMEGVFGNLDLVHTLSRLIRETAPKHKSFLACMAHNAIQRKPPLGFFRQFALEPGGEHANTFNIKRRGTAPISDLVRVHSLACGSGARNTLERLEDIGQTQLLAEGTKDDLKDAMEFISMVRIQNQARQIEAGKEPNNSIKPEDLSSFESRHLKDAFKIINSQQAFLRPRYAVSGLQGV
ncbi:putative nucleotidyltransferase substrate binding domain-containing protein [Desulfospira joergensenii]|uniref:putative nucleotidyltransferase substrate binding domain-containing protein n=1 Tax=Desulfospira joergensenii TaxID=53329 RepID=UPI001FCA2638|nr:putative nucleotidyltransferase substrate binding domain-containing protein [Desulfospira joergensenii]